MSILCWASNIGEYLLRETGSGAELLAESRHNAWALIAGSFMCLPSFRNVRRGISLATILKSLEEIDFPIDGHRDGILVWKLFEARMESHRGTYSEEIGEHIRIWREYGGNFAPFGWEQPGDMAHSERMLGVYLRADGDPNALAADRFPGLLYALFLTWENRHSRKEEEGNDSKGAKNGKRDPEEDDEGVDSEGVEEDCEESDSEESDSEEVDDGREPCLLTPLIRAGADIYYIDAEDSINAAGTLTHMALGWDLEDVWFNALERCGFDIDEVWDESKRRLAAFKKLHGAERSGVDVSCIVD